MGFKPMSIERLQWLQRRQRGFSLVETLVSVAVGSLVMAVIATLGYYGSLCMAVSLNYTAIDAASESAVNQLTRDARRANKVTSYTTNSLVLEDFDGAALTYAYDSSARTLTRTKYGVSTILLKECDALTFVLGKRNPTGAFESFPAATAAECKVIEAGWRCSRTILGRKTTTGSLASAKIVLRRQGT